MARAQEVARELNLAYLSLLALLVGIGTGYGAVAFRALISVVHNFAFLGELSIRYDANTFTPAGPWGPFIILTPVIGGLLVTWLVKTFAPEARGHGVPEVMDAVYYKGGVIRAIVVIVKSLASSLSIGTGGSVGREGPIVQIGSALASTLGGRAGLVPWQRITLVGAGAAGGIAATFNTPLGAVLFSIELMMPEVSVRTFLPVAISAGTATFIGREYFGFQPAFALPGSLPALDPVALGPLLGYAVLGVIMGLAATLYIRALYWSEDFFANRVGNPYLRHAIGTLALGIMIYLLFRYLGHYYVEGVGYATVQAVVDGQLGTVWLLALLFVAKLAATSLTLGSGGSGGVFSPALVLGATLGGAVGGFMHFLFPDSAGMTIPGFAMVGMAAMVGGATGAAMTATIMVFEMTRDYAVVMPMIVAVAISLGIRRLLSPDNIYTMKLTRRGHYIPQSLHAHMFIVRKACDVMDANVAVLAASTRVAELVAQQRLHGDVRHVIVTHGSRIAGIASVDTAARLHALEHEHDHDRDHDRDHDHEQEIVATLGQLATTDYVLARESDVMFDVIKRMTRRRAGAVLVVRGKDAADAGADAVSMGAGVVGGGSIGGSGLRRVPRADSVIGVITKERIADAVADSLTFRTQPGRTSGRPRGGQGRGDAASSP
jgi:CIC family chloride channel protein